MTNMQAFRKSNRIDQVINIFISSWLVSMVAEFTNEIMFFIVVHGYYGHFCSLKFLNRYCFIFKKKSNNGDV